MFALPLIWLGEPEGGGVSDDPWVVCLNFMVDFVVSSAGREDGGGNVVEDHLDHLNLFREASDRWDCCTDGSLK